MKAKRRMPINESTGTPRSQITKAQKKQMEAAAYGLQEGSGMQQTDVSPQDIERMRQLVMDHDRATGKMVEFDLNKPPQEALTYRPFPRLLYNWDTKKEKPVADEQQLAQALKEGWKKEAWPHYGEPGPPPQLSASAAAEAHEMNIRIAEARRKEEELRRQQEEQQSKKK